MLAGWMRESIGVRGGACSGFESGRRCITPASHTERDEIVVQPHGVDLDSSTNESGTRKWNRTPGSARPCLNLLHEKNSTRFDALFFVSGLNSEAVVPPLLCRIYFVWELWGYPPYSPYRAELLSTACLSV